MGGAAPCMDFSDGVDLHPSCRGPGSGWFRGRPPADRACRVTGDGALVAEPLRSQKRDRNSLPLPSAIGAASPAPGPASLTPARPGRTPTWRASTARPAMSSSSQRSSSPSWRPESSTRTSAMPTISTVPTVRWGYSRPRSSPRLSTARNSHPLWPDKRGPLIGGGSGAASQADQSGLTAPSQSGDRSATRGSASTRTEPIRMSQRPSPAWTAHMI